jgi:membrane-associated protein
MCAGYFLGQTFPWVANNIDYLILALLVLTVIPIAYEWWRNREEQATG